MRKIVRMAFSSAALEWREAQTAARGMEGGREGGHARELPGIPGAAGRRTCVESRGAGPTACRVAEP